MPAPYPIVVEVDGHICRGTWTLKQGGRVCVASAWAPAETVDCGKLRPEECAKRTLERIVRARREPPKDDARQEREVTRIMRRMKKTLEGDRSK